MDFVSYIPAIILLILGFGLVVLEMYLPGFGAPGILGFILLVAGVAGLFFAGRLLYNGRGKEAWKWTLFPIYRPSYC